MSTPYIISQYQDGKLIDSAQVTTKGCKRYVVFSSKYVCSVLSTFIPYSSCVGYNVS